MRGFMFTLASIFTVASWGLLADVGPAQAAQPVVTPAPVTPVVGLDQLVELGKSVAAIRYEGDNVFVYAERAEALRKAAQTLVGGQVEFVAKVMRVTETEVIVEVAPAGKTRLVLMHAAPPVFGNLRTVTYPGISSTRRLHVFSSPVGLRIGSEITLDVARTLRRRDMLAVRGTIDAMPVWIESVFAPDAIALISNWSIVAVNPPPAY